MTRTGVICGVNVKYDISYKGQRDNILIRRIIMWLRLPAEVDASPVKKIGCILGLSGFVSPCRGRRRWYNRIIGTLRQSRTVERQ